MSHDFEINDKLPKLIQAFFNIHTHFQFSVVFSSLHIQYFTVQNYFTV